RIQREGPPLRRSSFIHLPSSRKRGLGGLPPSGRGWGTLGSPIQGRVVMAFVPKPRRSIWMHGLEADEPAEAQRQEQARLFSDRIGAEVTPPPIPKESDFQMRAPRIAVPDALTEFCFTDNYERALHAKGD